MVNYHFDKVIHSCKPSQEHDENFLIMRPKARDYTLIEDLRDITQEHPSVRARSTWVFPNIIENLVQREIIQDATDQKSHFTIGRKLSCDVPIKIKAVSSKHCRVNYDENKGWFVSESGKENVSSNGTFVFLKSHNQM